jgi:acetophenone carboxylase
VGPEQSLVRINLTAAKKGDKIKLTFDGTSPMLPDRPLNTYFQGVIGLAMVYFCGWFLHDLPANNALLEILDWEFPDDSLVNAKGNAPTSLAPLSECCFAHGMFRCGARMTYHLDPLRAEAPWFKGFAVPIHGGINQWDEPVADIMAETNASGAGARSDRDGVDVAGAWFATMSDCSDVESTESERPFLYLFRNFFNCSYGHGKFRGGAGTGFGLMMHHVPWVAMGGFGCGSKFPSTHGIFGGYAVPPVFIEIVRKSNLGRLLSESEAGVSGSLDQIYQESNPEEGEREFKNINTSANPVVKGDTFYVSVGGGGGYGDVLERDPEMIMNDLRNGMVTHEAVQDLYKVAYNRESLLVDKEETEELRQTARKERLRKAKPFSEFEKEWLKLRPSEEALLYYGNYPNPSEGK